MYSIKSSFALLLCAPCIEAFTPSSSSLRSKTLLRVSVDPEVVTKKEYEDICGVSFNEGTLEERLKRTSYLYPKHVEVISDFEPLVDQLVDDIVSFSKNLGRFLVCIQILHIICFRPIHFTHVKIHVSLSLFSFLRQVKRLGSLRITSPTCPKRIRVLKR